MFAQEPLKLKAICLNQIGIMYKTRTGQLANAQEERDASNRPPSQIMELISNFFKISEGHSIEDFKVQEAAKKNYS